MTNRTILYKRNTKRQFSKGVHLAVFLAFVHRRSVQRPGPRVENIQRHLAKHILWRNTFQGRAFFVPVDSWVNRKALSMTFDFFTARTLFPFQLDFSWCLTGISNWDTTPKYGTGKSVGLFGRIIYSMFSVNSKISREIDWSNVMYFVMLKGVRLILAICPLCSMQ